MEKTNQSTVSQQLKKVLFQQWQTAWAEWKILLATALFFSLFENLAYWKTMFHLLDGGFTFINTIFVFSVFIVITCINYFLFSLVIWRPWFKVLLSIVFLISASINYFTFTYGIYIDRNMISNVADTTFHESAALLTPQYVIWFILGGLLPIWALWKLPFKKQSVLRRISTQVLGMAAAAVVFVVAALPVYKEYASFFRNNKEMVKLINPSNYIAGVYSYTKQVIDAHRPLVQIGLDAKRDIPASEHKPTLFILVVGETSRAQNTALMGYDRNTNPWLSKQSDLLTFKHTTSCGTNTATSVPCMFSDMPRLSYNPTLASHQENFLDIFKRLGIHVFWRENDSQACFNVCKRVPNENLPDHLPAQDCPDGLCYDEHLLDGLDKYVAQNSQGDIFIVLHTNGSHGPSYYQRYAPDMPHQFSPTCNTNQIQTCSHETLVNTYDNTMIHVDYMLNQTIEFLKKYDDKYNTGMFYVSDHGESLGENGIYLHSFPYMIAPKEQTHVPMYFWSNPAFLTDRHISYTCMKQSAATGEFSQDNLFHTMLGVMNVSTKEYQPNLDVFSPCETTAASK